MIKRAIILVILPLLGLCFSFSSNTNLDKLIENPSIIYQTDILNIDYVNQQCKQTKLANGNFLITLQCLTQTNYGNNDLSGTIDLIWDKIIDFDKEYDLESNLIEYNLDAQPIFSNKKTQKKFRLLKIIKQQLQNIETLKTNINKNLEIEISSHELALLKITDYSFYPVRRSLNLLGPCTLNNYWIAIASIDKKLLEPHEDFNINKRIAFRWGYCTGGEKARPFSAGVCGASSQLFRVSLLHPFLITNDREAHSQRLTRYYGEKITGDDSAIIDFRKQLTLTNISNEQIYFRYIGNEKNNDALLVAISPTQYDKTIIIKKEQTGELSAKLTKDIFSKKLCETSQSRISNYKSKSDYITE